MGISDRGQPPRPGPRLIDLDLPVVRGRRPLHEAGRPGRGRRCGNRVGGGGGGGRRDGTAGRGRQRRRGGRRGAGGRGAPRGLVLVDDDLADLGGLLVDVAADVLEQGEGERLQLLGGARGCG